MRGAQIKDWRGWVLAIAAGLWIGKNADMPLVGVVTGIFFWLSICGSDYLWNKLTRSKKQ